MTPQPIDSFTQEQRYREFAQQYLVDLNPVAAYRRCQWVKNKKRGEQLMSWGELLADVQVQGYIRELVEERRKRLDISTDAILQEQARIAFSDIRDFWEWSSQGMVLKDSGLIDEHSSRVVESLEMVERELMSGIKVKKVKIKLYNKQGALDALARHLGMETLKHEVNVQYGTVEVPALVERKDWMAVIKQEIQDGNGDTGHPKNGMAP